MPVGPLDYTFELAPSFEIEPMGELEGLALQAMQAQHRSQIASSTSRLTESDTETNTTLPEISDQFSLKFLDKSINDHEVIVLSDSE